MKTLQKEIFSGKVKVHHEKRSVFNEASLKTVKIQELCHQNSTGPATRVLSSDLEDPFSMPCSETGQDRTVI